MKKLNRRGFTLIELLAVVVVLAIIMVVTVPSIVDAVKNARQKAYEETLTFIETYVNDEYNKCLIDPSSTEDYNSEIFDDECNLLDAEVSSDIILRETNYKEDIDTIALAYVDADEKYVVIEAPVTSDGQFDGVTAKSIFSGGY